MSENIRLWPNESLYGIVPIIKVSFEGVASLVGTGFFITPYGHLITAKHVIDDNIDDTGIDIGGIGAVLLNERDFGEYLPLRRTYRHRVSDIALSSTLERWRKDGSRVETPYLHLSINEPPVGAPIRSRFYCHADPAISWENLVLPKGTRVHGTFTLKHSFHANAPGMPETTAGVVTSEFGYQNREGLLRQHWRPMRDRVMLPFPVFESTLAISGSGSGGPVINSDGFVVGINTTGIPGTDISYHTYIGSALDLGIEVVGETSKGELHPVVISLGELSRSGELDIDGVN